MAIISSAIFKSGDLFFPQAIRNFLESFIIGDYTTWFYISYWSILHIISGIVFAWISVKIGIKRPYLTGFGVHTAWELWQVAIGMSHPYKLRGHNGLIDIIMDTLLFMLGMWLFLTKNKFFAMDIFEDIIF